MHVLSRQDHFAFRKAKLNLSDSTMCNGYEFPSGTYTYSLMVNGKIADSKIMLLIK